MKTLVKHLIEENVDLRPEGFKREETPLNKAEDAVNEHFKRFGLQVSGFGVEPAKPEQLHYSVSAWYSDRAYELIEETIKKHFNIN